MAGVNKVILVGNIGQDIQMRKTPAGHSVVSVSLATSEKRKDATGQMQTQTEWHSIVLWNKLAELANQYLKKGSSVYIEGKLQTRSWDDNGVKKYKTEIIVQSMQFLGQKPVQGSNNASNQENAQNYASNLAQNQNSMPEDNLIVPEFFIDEDLPF